MRKKENKEAKKAIAISRHSRTIGQKVVIGIFAVLLFLVVIFPFYWIILSSFKTFLEIYEVPPKMYPTRLDFFNYVNAFKDYGIGRFIVNSLYVTCTTVIVTTAFSTMAAYALTRMDFKGSGAYRTFLKLSQMFPVAVLLVPLFLMCTKVNLYGTRESLILPYIAFQLPVSIILMSTYFVDIPAEMEEAALIDGCNLFQIFFRIMLPLAMSGIVAVSIYTFIQVWQEFLIASSFITNHNLYTLTVGLSTFKGEFLDWGGLMATSVIIAVPAMILFTSSQDFFINRLAGGVKE